MAAALATLGARACFGQGQLLVCLGRLMLERYRQLHVNAGDEAQCRAAASGAAGAMCAPASTLASVPALASAAAPAPAAPAAPTSAPAPLPAACLPQLPAMDSDQDDVAAAAAAAAVACSTSGAQIALTCCMAALCSEVTLMATGGVALVCDILRAAASTGCWWLVRRAQSSLSSGRRAVHCYCTRARVHCCCHLAAERCQAGARDIAEAVCEVLMAALAARGAEVQAGEATGQASEQRVQQGAGQQAGAGPGPAVRRLAELLAQVAAAGQQQHVAALLLEQGLVQAACLQLRRLLPDAAAPPGAAPGAGTAAQAGAGSAAGSKEGGADACGCIGGASMDGGIGGTDGSSDSDDGSSSEVSWDDVQPLVRVLHSLGHWGGKELLHHGAVPLMECVMQVGCLALAAVASGAVLGCPHCTPLQQHGSDKHPEGRTVHACSCCHCIPGVTHITSTALLLRYE